MRAFEFLTEALSTAAIDATANQLGNKLMPRLQQDTGYKKFTDPKQFIEWVASEIDPSPNSRYARWVVALYANGGSRSIKDLHKLTELLTRYAKLVQSGRIPTEYRDINKFKDVSSFLGLVDQYKEQKTSREIRSTEEQELLDTDQAVIYKDTGDIKIVIPKTKKASNYYGRGTKWCTAGRKNNKFESYNKWAPLYVLVFRDTGRKLQFHFHTAQFMDEQDKQLSPDVVKSLNYLFPYELWLVTAGLYGGIQYIKDPTEEMKLRAVSNMGRSIAYIKDPSEQVQLAAVRDYGKALTFIDNPSEEVQLAAVKKDGSVLGLIKNPTEEMKYAAIRNTGYAIQYIENPTEEMNIIAVTKDPASVGVIENPSERVQLAAVKNRGTAIWKIKNPSERVQLAAVNQDPGAIKYIKNPTERAKRLAREAGAI